MPTADATASLSAFAQSVGYVLAGGGPLLVGVLHGRSGGWTGSFVLLFAALAVMVVAGWSAARPRFVEDCVREMIRGVVDRLDVLTDQHFVSARQENLETIHRHNVVAERYGTLGELRAELATGEHSARHVAMREWLEGSA